MSFELDIDRELETDARPVTKAPSGFGELGVTGLMRAGSSGAVYEEFLRELSGTRAFNTYREMKDNDPVVGAILFTIETAARNVKWRVEGPDSDTAKFVDQCKDDMSTSWEDLIAEILSMLPFGFSFHEIVYKRRNGTSPKGGQSSSYSDGKIGWRKMPIRAQETLSEWRWDEQGGVQAFVQVAPPEYKTVAIPITRGLLFRTGSHKGNPEGRSILRNAYRPWYFKRRMEVIEGIGVERDLAGLPVIYRSGEVAERYDAELKAILRNVRRDEQEGVLLPLAYDENGKALIEFKLLSTAGARQFDVGDIIRRYSLNIAMSTATDFLLLGHEKMGSFALASAKTEMFEAALGTLLGMIASVLNRHAIPRLLELNNIPFEKAPKFVPGSVRTPDLRELAFFISSLASSGMQLFPDQNLENFLLSIGNLPQRSDDTAFTTPIVPPATPPDLPAPPRPPIRPPRGNPSTNPPDQPPIPSGSLPKYPRVPKSKGK